jgi:hypothetical protein
VCKLLGWLGKPYVIGLHGGNLPVFLHQRPRRGRVAPVGRDAAGRRSRARTGRRRPCRGDTAGTSPPTSRTRS